MKAQDNSNISSSFISSKAALTPTAPPKSKPSEIPLPEEPGALSLGVDQPLATGQGRLAAAKTTKLPSLEALFAEMAAAAQQSSEPTETPPTLIAAAPEAQTLKLAPEISVLRQQPRIAEVRLTAKFDPLAAERSSLLERIRQQFANEIQAPTKAGGPDRQSRLAMLEEAVSRLTSSGDPAKDRQALQDLESLLERDPALFDAVVADICQSLDAPPVVGNPLGAPERRVAYFQELVGQLARPESISQGQGTVTCAASVAQVMLLNVDPKAYYDLVRDLITKGSHTSKGGLVFSAPRDLPPLSGRSQLDAAIQDVLYQAAQNFPASGQPASGTGGESQNQSQGSRPAGDRPRGRGNQGSGGATYGAGAAEGGLYTGQIDKLLEELTGKPWVWEDITDATDKYRQQVWDAMKAHLTGQSPSGSPFSSLGLNLDSGGGEGSEATRAWGIPVGIYTEGGVFHEVLIQGFEKGQVLYYDPATGRQERCPEQTFFDSVCQVMVPGSGWDKYSRDLGRSANSGSGAAAGALSDLLS